MTTTVLHRIVERCATPCGVMLAALVLPTHAPAQPPRPPAPIVSLQEARALHDSATVLQSMTMRRRDVRRVAAMHLRSAALRGDADAEAYACLYVAGNLLYGIGDLEAAEAILRRAATQAADRGDIVNAAGAYLDLAVVAVEHRHADDAWTFGRKAELLMESPLLTDAQRAALRARVVHVQHVASSAR